MGNGSYMAGDKRIEKKNINFKKWNIFYQHWETSYTRQPSLTLHGVII